MKPHIFFATVQGVVINNKDILLCKRRKKSISTVIFLVKRIIVKQPSRPDKEPIKPVGRQIKEGGRGGREDRSPIPVLKASSSSFELFSSFPFAIV